MTSDGDPFSALPCPHTDAHEAHFWMSALVGGSAGSVPTLTFICPGR